MPVFLSGVCEQVTFYFFKVQTCHWITPNVQVLFTDVGVKILLLLIHEHFFKENITVDSFKKLKSWKLCGKVQFLLLTPINLDFINCRFINQHDFTHPRQLSNSSLRILEDMWGTLQTALQHFERLAPEVPENLHQPVENSLRGVLRYLHRISCPSWQCVMLVSD